MEFNKKFEYQQHLKINHWQKANRNLMAKSISELMREDIAKPKILNQITDNGLTEFRLETDKENIYYTFSAFPRYLNYWHIDKESIAKYENGKRIAKLNVTDFFIENQATFGINSFTLTHYVEELIHTLYADAYILAKGRLDSSKLVNADFQTIEHLMGGHPWVIVNKGRIGFSSEDYNNYSPEADKMFNLLWVAAHKKRASFHLEKSFDENKFFEKELGKEKLMSFMQILKQADLNFDDYIFIPVHPWQWNNKLAIQFAPDIATKHLLLLGEGEDKYSPQQSIRTLFNKSSPDKCYVKTAVSILNTSHIRGLSPKQLSVAPSLTTWLKNMLESDPDLQKMGVVLLGEIASVSYMHSQYSKISTPPYQYNEFLGAMWRESPVNCLKEGEKLMTMASLLYIDDKGESLVQELIKKSGLSTNNWLKSYLRAYLKPIMQIYYRHSIALDPHGQNVILIMKNYIPSRIAIQDFVGDILLNPDAQKKLPKKFSENMFLASPNPENAPLVIFIAVFDAFFRYLSNVLQITANYSEESFWKCVYQVIIEYQFEHPELKNQFKKYDLFIPEFKRLIFNSRRLYNGYEETSDFPHMKKNGLLPNPMYQIKNLHRVK
ncbi:MAG: IucA/IucC family protein [Tenacibaculum sp.]